MIADVGAPSRERTHSMTRRPPRITAEFLKRRASAQFVVIKEWLIGPDPDPTYDRLNGWKLDQFAMTFVPNLVREYKQARAEEHPSADPRDGFAPRNPTRTLDLNHKLSDEIRCRLLDARYEVKGYQFESNTPIVIPNALLEHMHPIIETSELRELYVPGEIIRWFEKVRVFDLAPATKSPTGRSPTYDWPRLVKKLESEKSVFANMAALVAYCRNQVTAVPGKKTGKGGPDDKTIRDAIEKYELSKFIQSAW
jgi:hypothetical protein